MVANMITLQYHNDQFSFGYRLEGENRLGQLKIPSSSFVVEIKLHLNNILLRSGDYGDLVDCLGHALESAKFWAQCKYKPHLFIEEDGNCTISLHPQCEIFPPITTELSSFFNNSRDSICKLTKVELSIHYNTSHMFLPIESLLDALHYSLVATILNLEHIVPLVFSPFGRNFFRINYNWLVQGIKEIMEFNPSKHTGVTQPKLSVDSHIASKLLHLQNRISTQYTTIQIVSQKSYYSRLQRAQKHQTPPDEEKQPFDLIPLTFDFVDSAAVKHLLS